MKTACVIHYTELHRVVFDDMLPGQEQFPF